MDNETGFIKGHMHSDGVTDFDRQFACVASVLEFKVIGCMENS
jgi:hypothetical protein